MLNSYENRVLQVLSFSIRELNTKEVAYYAHIDWATANAYLHSLGRKGYVSHRISGGVNYWRSKGRW